MGFIISKNYIGLLAIVSFLIALFLLMLPNVLRRINDILKKEISTSKIAEQLDKERNIDTQIFKIRKIIGILFLVLTVILTYLYIE